MNIASTVTPVTLNSMTKVSKGSKKAINAQLEHLAHEVELATNKRRRKIAEERFRINAIRIGADDEYEPIRPFWRKKAT